MSGTTTDRYPGPPPYEDSAEHHRLFSGRDPETRALTHQIIASRLLVVFGQSGLGKTSLLQAGVFRKLREEELFPVSLRLISSAPPLELITTGCEAACREFGIDYVPGTKDTAWEFFKTAMFWRGGTLVSPVLVFDQFEELFTLIDVSWRKKFAEEIGPLVSGNAPSVARERLKSADSRIGDLPPKVKIVFSLREEWYGALEELSLDIPGLFQNRFQLLPLPISQAKQAIENPAMAVAEGSIAFSTPPFRYDPSALRMMVDFLKGRFERIEPFQLQLLCQDVEQRTVKVKNQRQEPTVAQTPIVIMPEDLGGEQTMAAVLRRFYQTSLDALPLHQRFRARELCDTGLLSPAGHRLMLQADQVWREFRVTVTTLEYLVKKRILREVPRLESIFYEISHDRLAQSILKARRRRIPRKYRLPSLVAASVVTTFVIFVVLLNFKLREQRNAAIEARRVSEQARLGANETRERAEELASFLIGEDLMGSIRPLGRLEVMEGVEKRIDTYLAQVASQKEEGRSDLAIQIEGLAHLNRGDIADQRLELANAKKEYRQAQILFQNLLKRKNDQAEWWHSLADADAKLANVTSDQLRLSDAWSLNEDALAAIERSKVANQSPKNDKLADRILRDEADVHARMARILESQGKLTEAIRQSDQTLQIAKGSPETTQWLYVLLDGLIGKGKVLTRQGKNRAAQRTLEDALKYAGRAASISPFEPEAKYSEAIARNWLANLKAYGKPAQVLTEYEKVHKAIEEVTKWDRENKRWQRDSAATLMLVGDGYRFSNHYDKAESSYKDAQKKLNELRNIDDTNHSLEKDFVWLYQGLGQAVSRTGSEADPYRRIEDALKILDKLGEIDQSNYDIYSDWIQTATLEAELLTSQGDYDEAVQVCQRSFPVIKRIKTIDSTDAEYWETLAVFHNRMGNALQGKADYQGTARHYQEALNSIKRATDEAGENPRYWDDTRVFCDLLGQVRDTQGDKNGALVAYREKVRAAEKAAEVEPENAEYSSNLATDSQEVGDRLRDRHEFVEAAISYTTAERAFREAIAKSDQKDSATYQTSLFYLFCDHLAPLRVAQNDKSGMLKAYELAVAVRQSEVASQPHNASSQAYLAGAYEHIGDNLREGGELIAALGYYNRAEQAFREAIAKSDQKDSATYQTYLFGLFCDHLAPLRAAQNDKSGMLKAYELAVAVKQSEVASQPHNASSQSNLAAAYEQIGYNLRQGGELIAALDYYNRAEQVFREAPPQVDQKYVDVAKAYLDIGGAFREQRDLTKAQESYKLCDRALSAALLLQPSNADYWQVRYYLYDNGLAQIFMSRGEHSAALETYQQALHAITKAVELNGKEHIEYHYYVGLVHEHIGDVHGTQGQVTEGLQSYSSAEQEFRQAINLTKNDPKNTATYWKELCALLMKVAPMRADRGDHAGARQAYSKAQEAITTAIRLNPEESSYRATRSEIETKFNALKPR
jgi:tetratricopeptide (TPR) repeat protein